MLFIRTLLLLLLYLITVEAGSLLSLRELLEHFWNHAYVVLCQTQLSGQSRKAFNEIIAYSLGSVRRLKIGCKPLPGSFFYFSLPVRSIARRLIFLTFVSDCGAFGEALKRIATNLLD